MDKSITINNQLLGEYLRDKDKLDLEKEIQANSIESRNDHNLYQKPRLKPLLHRERNGKVKSLQSEVNVRNRTHAIISALENNDLLSAIICYIIGSKFEEKITTREIAKCFDSIIHENQIDFKYDNVATAIRNYLGRIKRTEFGEKFLTHVRNFKTGNYWLVSENGLNLKPEAAINFAKKSIPKDRIKKTIKSNKTLNCVKQDHDLVNRINDTVDYSNNCEKQNDILDKLGIDLNKIASNGLTINLFGPINIHIK